MLEQHQRFADKYFETLNGAESARYAGFAADSARQEGSRLLEREDIQAYLAKKRIVLQKRTGISNEKVLREVARLSFADIRDYYDDNGFLKLPKNLSDDAAAALAGIDIDEIWANKEKIGETKKIKLYDKPASLEKLMRHLGLYSIDNKQKSDIVLRFGADEELLGADVPENTDPSEGD